MGSGMLSLSAGPEKAPPDTTQADMLATEAVHETLLEILEIDSKIGMLYDERDARKEWVRVQLLRDCGKCGHPRANHPIEKCAETACGCSKFRERKSLTFADSECHFSPAVEPFCTCHNVPIIHCANASQGIPVVVKAVDCVPYLVVRAKP